MTSAVHQYCPVISPRDGVGDSIFFMRSLLEELGYTSLIYADQIHPELAGEVSPREGYQGGKENILFIHHAISQPDPGWFFDLPDTRVMVYHNITPSHFFAPGSLYWQVTRDGRDQLSQWQDRFSGVVAMSEYNSEEVIGLGYENVHVIPIYPDLEKLGSVKPDKTVTDQLEGTFNFLFVGRVVENKCQHDLIHAFAELGAPDARLFCVGGISSETYYRYLLDLISGYGLQDRVCLTGSVSDAALWGYYAAADLFVSLSEHEGFCIPIIEAAVAGIPVAAYGAGNIPYTLGKGGYLLFKKNARHVAGIWRSLMADVETRQQMAVSGQKNLERFSRSMLKKQLAVFLEEGLRLNDSASMT